MHQKKKEKEEELAGSSALFLGSVETGDTHGQEEQVQKVENETNCKEENRADQSEVNRVKDNSVDIEWVIDMPTKKGSVRFNPI